MTWWKQLLLDQRANQFADFSGARASVTIPVSDRVITALAQSKRPAALRDLDVRADGNNRLTVAIKLQSPSWLPRISAELAVERQPQLPGSPVLVLRLLSRGAIAALAGPAAKFLNVLPRWLHLERELVIVDLEELLRAYGAAEVLAYATRLELGTLPGAFVLSLEARVPDRT